MCEIWLAKTSVGRIAFVSSRLYEICSWLHYLMDLVIENETNFIKTLNENSHCSRC